MKLVVASNSPDAADNLMIELGSTITVGEALGTDYDMVVVVGELAYDFGFYEGFFLYDLFFKKLYEIQT